MSLRDGLKGASINKGLRSFNQWFDEFILVAAKPLAMLGFAMGTVDIFVRGVLATAYWFELSWAIVQALTIDGLFFTVWWRIFAFKWSRQTALPGVGLVGIGLVLELVAIATNGILGMQQLWGLADSQQAMIRLGVDPFYFSVVRAVLVVAVSTMVAFVTYKSQDSDEPVTTITPASQPVTTTVTPVLPPSQPVTPPLQLSAGSNRERVWQTLDQKAQEGRPINLRGVAEELGLSYDVVRKWASKKE